jgi:multidrug resistance protein MdtO
MASTATVTTHNPAFVTPRLSWTKALLQDLEPVPGRLGSALRIVLASIIALVLMEALQMPFIAIGMYFIFLIGRDSPAVSLRSSLFSFGVVSLAIFIELAVVIITDNDPLVRLLSVAMVTFIAGIIVVSTTAPALGSSLGLIYCTVIALWELHASADHLVKSSLYLIGTFTISLGCAVGIEYLFGTRDPAAKLQEQRHLRYVALEALFRTYADNAPLAQRFEAATRVSRIAIAGQSGMMALYNTIVERNLDTGTLPMAIRPRITMLAQLMDVSAAFGLQNPMAVDADTQARCKRIADACKGLIPGILSTPTKGLLLGPAGSYTVLDRVEGALHTILTMPFDVGAIRNMELVALPSNKVPFLIPGAIRRQESIAFGLKISLCATFCYILYHAVAWPGIATSVTTVLVTGLSSSGAVKQRLIFRLLGAIIGGLILGIGATVFLYPHMDSITSLVVLEAVIAFISAWIAAGPKFNYIGLQIAFSFYVVSYEGLTAPTELAPARDRLIGILIALAVMWFVFDRVWPVRTTTVMRRGFATVLGLNADLFTRMNSTDSHATVLRYGDLLRDRVGKTIADLRSMNGSVPYEFGTNRTEQIQTGDTILRATLSTAALFWHQFAVLHTGADSVYLTNAELRKMRSSVAMNLRAMAQSITQQSTISVAHADSFISADLLSDPQFGEYARNTAARYEELRSFTNGLTPQT